MAISHHKLYPATAEIHRNARGNELTEVTRLATYARDAETKPSGQSQQESESPQESGSEDAAEN